MWGRQQLNGFFESLGVAQEGGYVTKEDSWLGEVGNGANVFLDRHGISVQLRALSQESTSGRGALLMFHVREERVM